MEVTDEDIIAGIYRADEEFHFPLLFLRSVISALSAALREASKFTTHRSSPQSCALYTTSNRRRNNLDG